MTTPDRASVLIEASDVARRIAERCRANARVKTGDDRKHWHAMAAGASMVALRLTELSDAPAARAAHQQTTGEAS